MKFNEAIEKDAMNIYTENGQIALNTSNNACVDFFSVCGALRETSKKRITRLFEDSYSIDPLVTTKIMFYLRDIREGLGERETFRTLLTYASTYHPECIIPNIHLIGFYGRYDDLYSLINTPVEEKMWEYVRNTLKNDLDNYSNNKPITLLAKWLKTADASSKNTRKLGIYTARKLGYSVYDYKRIIRKLRKYSNIVEIKMSQKEWDSIEYSKVPSNAMMKYRNAFYRRDNERFSKFITRVINKEEKINTGTLYPYDIVEKFIGRLERYEYNMSENEIKMLNTQWDNLPNYVDENSNVIIMADTSGSMFFRPMSIAVSLAIYFAQRNSGPYKNLWMNFSSSPKFHKIRGQLLSQIIDDIDMSDWGMNTDLNAAMEKILDIAVKNNVSQDEMPKALVVISDMEIDYCTDKIFYDKLVKRFKEYGYSIPNIIFWNVNSRHDIFHTNSKQAGVQLVSGSSPSVFNNLMNIIDLTPEECMYRYINSERYQPITICNM